MLSSRVGRMDGGNHGQSRDSRVVESYVRKVEISMVLVLGYSAIVRSNSPFPRSWAISSRKSTYSQNAAAQTNSYHARRLLIELRRGASSRVIALASFCFPAFSSQSQRSNSLRGLLPNQRMEMGLYASEVQSVEPPP